MKKCILSLSILFLLLAALPVLAACKKDKNDSIDDFGFERPQENCWLTECLVLPDARSADMLFGIGGESGLVNEEILAQNGKLSGDPQGYVTCLIYGRLPANTEIKTHLEFCFVSDTRVLYDEECVRVGELECIDTSFEGKLNAFAGAELDMTRSANERLQLKPIDRTWGYVQGVIRIPFWIEFESFDGNGTLYVNFSLDVEGVNENYSSDSGEIVHLGTMSTLEPHAEIGEATVRYLPYGEYNNGEYSDDALQATAALDNGDSCYAVLDFSIIALADNDGARKIHVLTHISDRGVIGSTIEEAPTGKIEEISINGGTAHYAVYGVPAVAGESKRVRMVLRLTPISDGETQFGIFFTGGDGTGVIGETSIHNTLKTGTPALKYTLSEDGTYWIVSGIVGSVINIPDTLGDGLPVLEIQEGLFENNETITSLTVGNNITEIRDREFELCKSLTSVSISDGVTKIGEDAFYGCTALKQLTIGKGVASIGEEAFYGCNDIESIYFNAVECADIPYSNTASPVFDSDIQAAVVIGADVKYIPPRLFFDTGIVSLDFEEGSVCTEIRDYAFSSCGLRKITIPQSLIKIGYHAFYGCRSLKEIWYYAKSCKGPEYAFDTPFANCGSDVTVVIGESVLYIYQYMFGDCVKSMTIRVGLNGFHSRAFYVCDQLTEIYYDGKMEDLDSYWKYAEWSNDIPRKIVCSDGTINL